MKTIAAWLITLGLTSAGLAQPTDIYWTGNGDRWGASPHNKWSLTAGGADYYQLQGGAEVHMNYDRNNMEGTLTDILVNRQGVVMHSLNMTGNALGEGFALTLTDNANNNTGITLAGPLTVHSGQHSWVRPVAENPDTAVFGLTVNSTWTIAEDAALLWAIPLAGSFGITKEGSGTLAFAGDHSYTGDTAINAGAFGVSGGDASLAGNLTFAEGAKFLFSDTYTLTLAADKQVTFGGTFGVADLVGLDSSVAVGTYTVVEGDVVFDNLVNVGLENAADLGDGKLAYFEPGSLQLVVVPEPSTLALAALGIAGLLIFRRRPRI